MSGGLMVIVVEHSRPELTEGFLRSVEGAGPVLVVKTGKEVGAVSEGVWKVVHLPDNPGYAEAVNSGLKLGLAAGFGCFAIANNDIVLEPGALEALEGTLRENGQLGMVAPVITMWPRTDLVWFAGGTLWGHLLVPRHPGIGLPVKVNYPALMPTEWLSGAFMVVRREAIEAAGLMPEGYFMYMEDVEWSLRVRWAGWELAVLGKPLAHHVGAASSGGKDGIPSPLAARYMARNAWKLKRRLRLGWPFYVGQVAVRLPYYVAMFLVGRRPDASVSYARGFIEGVAEYVRRKG